MTVKSLKDCIQTPVSLNDNASATLMACCLMPTSFENDPEVDALPIVKIVKNNAARRGLTITNGAALLIALTCGGIAGAAIAMLHSMNLQRAKRDANSGADVMTIIDHDDFVHAFSRGTPSRRDYELWWDNGGKAITNSEDRDVWPLLLEPKAEPQES